jgi:DNA-binding NarL/FixJ family response regulator
MLRVAIVGAEHLAREGLRALLVAEGCEVPFCIPHGEADALLSVRPANVLLRYDVTPDAVAVAEPDQSLPTVQLAPMPWLRHNGSKLLARGFRAVVDRDCQPEILVRILHMVDDGYVVAPLDAGIPSSFPPFTQPLLELTDRELSILRLVHQGLSNRVIAEALHISPGTVKGQLSIILRKLKVKTRVQAALAYETSELTADRLTIGR